MEPLNLIYWIKFGLGILAAILCMIMRVDNILFGIMISILIYIVGDKILKQIFITKVSNLSAITKTGISVYFMSWVFFWILLYTLFPY
ncbi:MAG: hypothetical protein QXR84_06750 [Candidatus Bathyarchaeia archaeon]